MRLSSLPINFIEVRNGKNKDFLGLIYIIQTYNLHLDPIRFAGFTQVAIQHKRAIQLCRTS